MSEDTRRTTVYFDGPIHPDRLKEEKEREMTIDLGFAWLTLPSGREVSIVDARGPRAQAANAARHSILIA